MSYNGRKQKVSDRLFLKVSTKTHFIPTVRHEIYAHGFVRILLKHDTYARITAQTSQAQACSSQTTQGEVVFGTHTSARVATVWNEVCSVGAVRLQTGKNVPISLPVMRKSMPVDNYLALTEISCYGIGMQAYAPKTRAVRLIANQLHIV